MTFLGEYGYEAARSAVLEENGRYIEAAEVCLNSGQLQEAVRLLLLHSHDSSSVLRAYQGVLDGLWGSLSIGVDPKSASRCLPLLRLIDRDSPERVHRDQASTREATVCTY